jgi:predicted transcriptional regulator
MKVDSPRSVRAPADSLEYDKGVVSWDLQKLAEFDAIECEENARARATRLKHRHVAIKPAI